MDEQEYSLEWLAFAKNDLGSAEFLLDRRPLPIEVICYLCQQSAEKCLKGVLVLQNIIPPKTHNLDELYILCEPFVADIETIKIQCNFLNKYSVTPRYPREMTIAEDDVQESLKCAKNILVFLRRLFPAKQED
jgi:HEPN domain-containing protein